MTDRREDIDRRHFLFQSASFLVGSILGFNGLSRAFACEGGKDKAPFQPRIAIIIDDIGYSRSLAKQFLEFGVPMTFAVLPRLLNSHNLAVEIHDRGQEVMLHQPMEPYNPAISPGPGALYVGDGEERIIRVIEENISCIPFAAGVNNHMGSRFTSSRIKMSQTLPVIREKGLFFVDSLTSGRSTAYRTAKRLQMNTAYRNIFLDNRLNESAILSQLNRLKRHALKHGHAIGIGHPHTETARAIGRFLNGIRGSNISMVHVSMVLDT